MTAGTRPGIVPGKVEPKSDLGTELDELAVRLTRLRDTLRAAREAKSEPVDG